MDHRFYLESLRLGGSPRIVSRQHYVKVVNAVKSSIYVFPFHLPTFSSNSEISDEILPNNARKYKGLKSASYAAV